MLPCVLHRLIHLTKHVRAVVSKIAVMQSRTSFLMRMNERLCTDMREKYNGELFCVRWWETYYPSIMAEVPKILRDLSYGHPRTLPGVSKITSAM